MDYQEQHDGDEMWWFKQEAYCSECYEVYFQRPWSSQAQCVDLTDGVLDDSILSRVEAICQQLNCVGCDGMGLAEGVAKKLPYGCPYRDRRPQLPGKFAIQQDRAKPGTIDVRKPSGGATSASGRPIVINKFAQWDLDPAEKYDRVKPAPSER